MALDVFVSSPAGRVAPADLAFTARGSGPEVKYREVRARKYLNRSPCGVLPFRWSKRERAARSPNINFGLVSSV